MDKEQESLKRPSRDGSDVMGGADEGVTSAMGQGDRDDAYIVEVDILSEDPDDGVVEVDAYIVEVDVPRDDAVGGASGGDSETVGGKDLHGADAVGGADGSDTETMG